MKDTTEQNGIMPFREHVLTAEAYLLCTPAGRVRYASGPLKILVDEDLSGRNLNDFLEDTTAARLVAEILAGASYDFSCTIRGQAFRAHAEPWEEGDGIQIELFPVNSLKEKRTSRGMAGFAARELHRELGVLMPAVQLLEDSGQPGQEDHLAVMKLHLHRLLRMSANLEDLALLEKDQLKAHYSDGDLTAICRELLDKAQPYCDACKILLHRRLPEGPMFCRVDVEKVQRMLYHLIANAIQAQKAGGAITVSLQQREDGQIALSVTDRGAGIGRNVFGEIDRRQAGEDLLASGGLGLGLLLTRAYAEAHGGNLILMSGERDGLSVRITLPDGSGRPLDELHAWRSVYGAGLDQAQVELSCVGVKELYKKKK